VDERPANADPERSVAMVPAFHPQWQTLDFAELLSHHTAFISIDAQNSILSPSGCLSDEGMWRRAGEPGGSLHNTLRLAAVCREARMPRMWLRYDRFIGERTPCTPMDEAQYRFWNERYGGDAARKTWEAELVDEAKAIIDARDVTFVYPGWSIFASTPVTRYLSMWGTKSLILCGYHTDWCVEMAARSARDLGYMPVVVGDACGSTPEMHEAALRQINDCYAPVMSTDAVVDFIRKGAVRFGAGGVTRC
jgi:nicotinamidase-related amidase